MRKTKKSERVIARDKKVFMTTTREQYNFVAERGEGDFAYDADGNKAIDFSSFVSVYNFGLNNTLAVRNAIKRQMDKLMHAAFTDYYSELPVDFAELLLKQFPAGFGKIFLSNSGTEANEDAIKIARFNTKKHYLIGFYGAFHGRSLGSLSLTSSKVVQRAHLGPFSEVIHAPYPNPYRCIFGHSDDPDECGRAHIEYIRDHILKREAAPGEVAAIFLEPIQGEGGYIVPPKSFVKGLRELADENDIVLVADEIQAGYMRTGKFLALDNFGVSADIYTMAKTLGAGMPMAATISKDKISSMPQGKHAGTFAGNLAIVAGAYEQLKHVSRNRRKIEAEVKVKGRIAMKRLQEMRDDYEIVGDARGIGMMLAIEIVRDKKSKAPNPNDRERILKIALDNGLLMLGTGDSAIRVIPPLSISKSSLEKGLDILGDSINSINKRIKG